MYTVRIILVHRMETLLSIFSFLLVGHLVAALMGYAAVFQERTTDGLLLTPLASLHLSGQPAAKPVRTHRAVVFVEEDIT